MCIYLTSQDLTGLAPIKQQRHENYTNTYCGGKWLNLKNILHKMEIILCLQQTINNLIKRRPEKKA